MFTNVHFNKLFLTPGITMPKIIPFMPDRRLTEPFAIVSDMCMKFGEYDIYPEELGVIVINNGC